jgi:hypothetical protein
MDVTYRWVNGWEAVQDEWDHIESVLMARGWMSLNRNTSRILLAELDGEVIAFNVFQALPYVGPLHVDRKLRGTGIAAELADRMLEFLVNIQARGFLTIAESPHSELLCEQRGMTRVEKPVYVMTGPGGLEL